MSVIEIVLIIIGAGIFLLGYFLPTGKKDADEEVQLISEAEIRKLVEGETETVREKVSDIVEETIGYSIEKTERAMERVANEKIMAVNEYSDTVLEEINKNHKEVTFLYDMLNDKHETLLADIGQANQVTEEIRQTVRDAEITAGETAKKAKAAEEAAEGALARIRHAESAAREAQEAVQEAVQSVMGAVEDTRTDLWSIHSAGTYSPEIVEEVQAARVFPAAEEIQTGGGLPAVEEKQDMRAFPAVEEEETFYGQETGDMSAVEESEEPVAEKDDFQPIRPRRVEIIHEPEADYVAEPELSASAAFAEMGIFGNKEPTGRRDFSGFSGRELGGRETGAASVPEEPHGVDIRFAQGKDNGRNSNERILELHKAGKSNMAIAKELGLGLGEVKLVIDLFEGM